MFFEEMFCLTIKTLGQNKITLSHQFNIKIEIEQGSFSV